MPGAWLLLSFKARFGSVSELPQPKIPAKAFIFDLPHARIVGTCSIAPLAKVSY